MHDKELEQIKSYSKLIVYELHKVIFEDAVFDKLKATLTLAEELECYLMQIELERANRPKNVVPFRRIA